MSSTKNPISFLQKLCVMRGWQLPKYKETQTIGPPNERLLFIRVTLSGLLAYEGRGMTKKAAKTEAAAAVLRQIQDDDIARRFLQQAEVTTSAEEQLTTAMSELEVEERDDAEDKIIIQRLYTTCCQNGFSVPFIPGDATKRVGGRRRFLVSRHGQQFEHVCNMQRQEENRSKKSGCFCFA